MRVPGREKQAIHRLRAVHRCLKKKKKDYKKRQLHKETGIWRGAASPLGNYTAEQMALCFTEIS